MPNIEIGTNVIYQGKTGVVLRINGDIAKVAFPSGSKEIPISSLEVPELYFD